MKMNSSGEGNNTFTITKYITISGIKIQVECLP